MCSERKNNSMFWPRVAGERIYVYCHVSGICVTNKTGFWIWLSNLLDIYTAGYSSSEIPIWHCHLLPTGHSTGTILIPIGSSTTPLYSVVLLQFWSPTLFCTTYKSSARTPRKTPSSVVKNVCLLARYIAMDVLILTAYALGMCLPNRCLATGMCVTILISCICLTMTLTTASVMRRFISCSD
jgi:hypothetical protein